MKHDITWGVSVFNENFNTCIPLPKTNVVTVFNFIDAYKAFNYCNFLDYVICLQEDTMTYKIAYCVSDAEEIYKNTIE